MNLDALIQCVPPPVLITELVLALHLAFRKLNGKSGIQIPMKFEYAGFSEQIPK